MKCNDLVTCKFSCPYADTKKRLKKEQIKTAKEKEAEEKREKEKPEKDLLSTSYSRVSQLRKERNITAEDVVKASLGFAYDRSIKRMNDIESGKAVSLQDRMPGGIWANEAKNLIATADLLGCSIDYLLGRTDCVTVSDGHGAAPEKCVNIDTGWRTGTPDEAGKYIALVRYHPEASYAPEKYEWTGEMWLDYGEPVEPLGILVDYWMPIPGRLPGAPNEEPARNGEPCMTGMSDSGLCGAAAYCNEPHDCCLQCDDSSCSLRCGWIDKEDDHGSAVSGD